MNSATVDLRQLFANALEVREGRCGVEGNDVARLNNQLVEKRLGGRVVVLSLPDERLPEAYSDRRHSHLFPSGRLGSFAVRHSEESGEPELVTTLHDLRGAYGTTILAPVTEFVTPHDVEEEQMDCGVTREVCRLMKDPEFTFTELAKLCSRVPDSNLGLALFAAVLNDRFLPYTIASALYTYPAQVHYFNKGRDVGLALLHVVRYVLSGSDMFSLMAREKLDKPTLHISNLTPEHPMIDFRSILIDHDIHGYDLPTTSLS